MKISKQALEHIGFYPVGNICKEEKDKYSYINIHEEDKYLKEFKEAEFSFELYSTNHSPTLVDGPWSFSAQRVCPYFFQANVYCYKLTVADYRPTAHFDIGAEHNIFVYVGTYKNRWFVTLKDWDCWWYNHEVFSLRELRKIIVFQLRSVGYTLKDRLWPDKVRLNSYIYILKADGHNWFKIGVSKDPSDRFKILKTLPPFGVYSCRIFRCENAYRLESVLHNIFADKRINGEWFELDYDYMNVDKCDISKIEILIEFYHLNKLYEADNGSMNYKKYIIEYLSKLLEDKVVKYKEIIDKPNKYFDLPVCLSTNTCHAYINFGFSVLGRFDESRYAI